MGGGHPRRRGAPARAAGRGRARPRGAASATSCASGGRTSPTSRCGRTSGCSSRSTARRCRAGPGTVELLDGIVDGWIEPAARGLHGATGCPREEALAQARLGVAVSRGLLLDLLATGDRDGRRRRHGGLHRARRGETGRIFRSPFAGPTLESAHTTRRGHRRAGGARAARSAHAAPKPFFDVREQAREVDAAGGDPRARAAPGRPGGRRARPGDPHAARAGAAGRRAERSGRAAPRRTSRCATCARTSPRSASTRRDLDTLRAAVDRHRRAAITTRALAPGGRRDRRRRQRAARQRRRATGAC